MHCPEMVLLVPTAKNTLEKFAAAMQWPDRSWRPSHVRVGRGLPVGVLLLLLPGGVPPPIQCCASIPMAMLMLPTNGRVVCGALYIIQRSRNPHRVSLQSMPGQSPNPPLLLGWKETSLWAFVWVRPDI